MVIANVMFSAPVQDFRASLGRGGLGDLNPTPWAFMLGNCYGWSLYGILRGNFFVFFANAPGFLLSIWLNLGAVKLIYQTQQQSHIRSSLIQYLSSSSRPAVAAVHDEDDDDGNENDEDENENENVVVPLDEDDRAGGVVGTSTAVQLVDWAKVVGDVMSQSRPVPAPHERLILGVVTVWTAASSFVGFVGSTNMADLGPSVQVQAVGVLVNLNLVFFYGAPLSTIWTVLQTRSSNSIHVPTMITNTLNGTFWFVYGVAGVWDPFIFVPNGLGALLGAIQIVLLVLFPRSKRRREVGPQDDDGQELHKLRGRDETDPEAAAAVVAAAASAVAAARAVADIAESLPQDGGGNDNDDIESPTTSGSSNSSTNPSPQQQRQDVDQ
jgi:solute carrier family 50 protein (sugar transporter)